MSEFHFIDAGSDSKAHSVVFALKTPAAGHSGLSHLAEHMSFRRSPQYPCAHELFTANTLLPVTINATTFADHTFFFATSDQAHLLLDAAKYLYCGLLNRDYGSDEVALERDGVIFNELAMSEASSDYALNAAIRFADTSKNAYQHAGGFTQTIGSNSIQALQDYKRKWYRPNTITTLVYSDSARFFEQCKSVVTALSVETALSEKTALSQLPPPNKDLHSGEQAPINTSITSGKNKSIRDVFTWWFPQCFLHSLKQQELTISSAAGPDYILLIDTEINHLGRFAVRLITQKREHKPDEPVRHQGARSVSTCLASLTVTPATAMVHTNKHAKGVERAIRYFRQETSPECRTSDTAKHAYLASVNKVTHSYMNMELFPALSGSVDTRLQVNNGLKPKSNVPLASRSTSDNTHTVSVPRLITAYPYLISLENLPALPQLLQPLTSKTTSLKRFNAEPINSFSGSHWVYRIAFYQQSRLQGILANHLFWQPRTSGECYALGAANFNGNLYLYGASDINIKAREKWCHAILSSSY